MELTYREMTIDDYEASYALWAATEGMVLSSSDSREEIARFLARNPGCSFVCGEGDRLLGTLLAGHDGRRGFLYHVAVAPNQRGRGIGGSLVRLGLAKLREAGIEKCHLFVLASNDVGRGFWARSGWEERDGILLFSRDT
ncbi:GNAT family N-acetyltransferase [Paenibacillus sacheonensis]|uniref:GNAT family N-acetyltransferase n=1 Tax=Paenibacillus sacheonensis TaxID=742054 RepID=A0A7X5C1E0_9BACL|nr:GNAT family N-acetyltransferase [Paenibacillus sacheonensis]MBM7568949.1 ribosomal protein S18 acetylase RimI-like enzyme [Paenibacillus sacheonensis]NBC72677.1 GNAT family N-acetyltransferase [Paenibacillus sacheonensis]